jgi:hypothetical protein
VVIPVNPWQNSSSRKVSESIITVNTSTNYNHFSYSSFEHPRNPEVNMAPKQQRQIGKAAEPRRPAQKGYLTSTYQTLTSPENASVVRSIAVFGVAVAFFSSSWSEFLLPP